MTAKKNVKDHRAKKNPKSAEAYQRERQERNLARPFQFWVPTVVAQIQDETITEDGHWERGKA